jgi:hypothetical protein
MRCVRAVFTRSSRIGRFYDSPRTATWWSHDIVAADGHLVPHIRTCFLDSIWLIPESGTGHSL